MTQFYRQKDTGLQYRGSCGQTALAVCMAAARGYPADFEGVGELMHHLTSNMIARGIAAPNGASRLSALAEQARAEGCNVLLELTYQEPLLADWRGILREHAGTSPILLQVARGEALTDAETGTHDDAGLQYHAIAIVGQRADGASIGCDSDHPDIMRRYQIYPEAILADAIPCGLLMLAMQRTKA